MENLINNINSFFENIDSISEIKEFVNAFETNNFTQKKNRLFSEHNLTKFINRDIFRRWKDSDNHNKNITYIKNIYNNERKKRKKISKEIKCKEKSQNQIIDDLKKLLIDKDKEISLLQIINFRSDAKNTQLSNDNEELNSKYKLLNEELKNSEHKNELLEQKNSSNEKILVMYKEQIDMMKYLKDIIK